MKRGIMDMTKGNTIKQLLLFAVPMLIGNVFQQLYNLADSAIKSSWMCCLTYVYFVCYDIFNFINIVHTIISYKENRPCFCQDGPSQFTTLLYDD